MKKFLFVSNILFVAIGVVLLALLLYCGFTKGFTLVILTCMFVELFIVMYSIVELIKIKKGGE